MEPIFLGDGQSSTWHPANVHCCFDHCLRSAMLLTKLATIFAISRLPAHIFKTADSLTTTCDPQRNTRRLLSPLALKRTLGVRLPSNLLRFNNNMGAATHLPLRMVCEVHHTKSHYEQSQSEGDRTDAYMGTGSPEATDLSRIIAS